MTDSHHLRLFIFCLFILLTQTTYSKSDSLSVNQQLGGDGYREGQFSGLGRAASEIFYSEYWISFSGYAELAVIFDDLAAKTAEAEQSGGADSPFAEITDDDIDNLFS